MNSIEQTGAKFNLQTYFQARALCQKVVDRIAAHTTTGMREADGQALIKEEFLKEGINRFWHPSKFRICKDTLKTFRDLPDQELQLQKDDVFFVDVGPILEEHEADYGQTFLHSPGAQPNPDLVRLIESAQRIWLETAHRWKQEQMSGKSLYDSAATLTESLGYKLNPLMAGHRLGDFPHSLYSRDRLSEMSLTPKENLWVLEIHIRDERLERGAFFEDVLS